MPYSQEKFPFQIEKFLSSLQSAVYYIENEKLWFLALSLYIYTHTFQNFLHELKVFNGKWLMNSNVKYKSEQLHCSSKFKDLLQPPASVIYLITKILFSIFSNWIIGRMYSMQNWAFIVFIRTITWFLNNAKLVYIYEC